MPKKTKIKLVGLLLLNLGFLSCSKDHIQAKHIKKKANYLCSLIQNQPNLKSIQNFTPSFQKALPAANLNKFFKNIVSNQGKCLEVIAISKSNPYTVKLLTDQKKELIFTLSLRGSDHLIDGLQFQSISKNKYEKYSDFICHSISNNPNFKYEDYFHGSFRKALPYEQLVNLFSFIYKESGSCQSKEIQTNDGFSGTIITKHKNATHLKFLMALAEEHGKLKIAGLRYLGKIIPPIKINSFTELENILKKQKGLFSFYFAPLAKDPILNFQGEKRHALGSVFKLYILATLSKMISEGTLTWEKEVKIKESLKSLPSGNMQNLKEGTPIALQKYAEKMISISDNTAADHLLSIVTKKSVENFMAEKRVNSYLKDNAPFMSTLEVFKTKAFFTQQQANNYLTLSRDQRSQRIQNLPDHSRENLLKKISTWAHPRYIDTIEWFATPQDICNLYRWMENSGDKKIRKILSSNTPFIDLKKSNKWAYAGYKGGSEPGVLEMAYLLEDKSGEKYCLYIGNNNKKESIDQNNFFALVEGVFSFLEKN